MVFLYLIVAFALSVMIVVLLLTNVRVTQEVKTLRDQLAAIENSRSALQDNLSSARRNLEMAEEQMRSLRNELRAEIEAGLKELNG